MKKEKIHWFFGPKEYEDSGIYKYCNVFIDNLSNKLEINRKYIHLNAKNPLRYFYQLFILPLTISIFYRKKKKVFSDESFLLLTLFPLFPYQNSYFIIQDYRDYTYTKKQQKILDKIYFSLLRKSFRNTTKIQKIICGSDFTREILINKFKINKDKIITINNSFNTESKPLKNKDKIKKILAKKYNFPEKSRIVLNVGSEEERKNVDILIKSMQHLNGEILIKIGKPIINSNRKKHLKLIEKLRLKHVYFIDKVSEEELNQFYQISDVYISPSQFEGFGRTPIEAQINRLPVIASEIEPFKSNLKDGAIYLSDSKNEKEAILKIKKILKDQKLRKELIQKGLKNVKRFDVKLNTQKFYDALTKTK